MHNLVQIPTGLQNEVQVDPGLFAQAWMKHQVAIRKDGNANPIKAHIESRAKQFKNDSAYRIDGINFARQLEYIDPQILEEKFPLPNSISMFPIKRIPFGATTFIRRRRSHFGDAAFYKGGKDIPLVGLTAKEGTAPIRHLVCGFKVDVFEKASSDYAGNDVVNAGINAMRSVLLERANRVNWYGDDNVGLFGVTDYPYLNKVVINDVLFNGTANADLVLAKLMALVNFPTNNSLSVFSPDTIVFSPNVYAYLSSTPRTTGTDTTILEFFLRNNPRVKVAKEAWELQGTGPGGEDGIFLYRSNTDAMALVMSSSFNVLPVQHSAFDDLWYAHMDVGGADMADSGNNILAWVTGPSVTNFV